MRAIFLGLVGAVLASAGAQAGCPVDRAVLVLVDQKSEYFLNEPLARPDLVGKTFRISRYVEAPKISVSPRNGDRRNVGYEAYQIRNGRETLVIKRNHIDGSPALTVASAGKDQSRIGEIDWARCSKKVPEFDGAELVNFGPLSALTIEIKSCR